MNRIVIGPYHEAQGRIAWGARLKDRPEIARFALDAGEAIGRLVMYHPEIFGVEIEQVRHGEIATPSATKIAIPSSSTCPDLE